jgi:acetyl esterase/lipase
MLEDVRDFWIWVRENLQTHLTNVLPGIEVDLSKVLAYGDSAGGALAVQLGLLIKPPGFIKSVIASAPPPDVGWKRTRPIIGAPTVPKYVLEQLLKFVEPDEIVTSLVTPERMPIALSLAQQGRLLGFFGTADKLSPVKVLDIIEDMPFMIILHGKDDTAVPVEGSVEFAEMASKRFGAKVALCIQPGQHGFDNTANLNMPWLKDGLKQVTEEWLGEKNETGMEG